jgi:hypothetical protein
MRRLTILYVLTRMATAIKAQNGIAILCFGIIESDLIAKRCMLPYALANDSEIKIPPR